jgi:predicted small secreted protein
MIKKITFTVLMALYIFILMGCNTLHGMGQDLKSVGESIEKAADK